MTRPFSWSITQNPNKATCKTPIKCCQSLDTTHYRRNHKVIYAKVAGDQSTMIKHTPEDSRLAQKIIESTSNPKHGFALFSIGPYGNRISFASQQQRSLSLVWALHVFGILPASARYVHHEESQTPHKRVAIIGGGLSGITAAAALITTGHHCTVFERSDDLLPNLSNTNRHIHPTINFWPLEPLAPATDFPFLNWYEDSPNGIKEQISGDIEYLKKHPNFQPLLKTQVSALDVRSDTSYDDKDRVKIYFHTIYDSSNTDPNKDLEYRNFDLAIVCSGFAKSETPNYATDCTQYWDNSLNNLENDANFREKYRHIVIAGSGDGGLIEETQALYKNFDNGLIISRFAEQIDAEIYSHNAKLRADLIFADTALKAKKYQQYYKWMSTIANDLLPVFRKKFLSRTQYQNADRTVTMAILKDENSIYDHRTAPIHRLIHYFSAQRQDTQTLITKEHTHQDEFLKLLKDNAIDPKKAFVVARLSPTYHSDELLDDETRQHLKEVQVSASDTIFYNRKIRNYFLINQKTGMYNDPESLSKYGTNKYDAWILPNSEPMPAEDPIVDKYYTAIKNYFFKRYDDNFDAVSIEYNETDGTVRFSIIFITDIPAEWRHINDGIILEMYGIRIVSSTRQRKYTYFEGSLP